MLCYAYAMLCKSVHTNSDAHLPCFSVNTLANKPLCYAMLCKSMEAAVDATSTPIRYSHTNSDAYLRCFSDNTFVYVCVLRLRLALCKRMALTAAVKFPLCKACGKVRVATPRSKLCKAGFSEKCAAAGALSSGNPKRGRSKRRAGALSSGNVLSLLLSVFFLQDFVGKG